MNWIDGHPDRSVVLKRPCDGYKEWKKVMKTLATGGNSEMMRGCQSQSGSLGIQPETDICTIV